MYERSHVSLKESLTQLHVYRILSTLYILPQFFHVNKI